MIVNNRILRLIFVKLLSKLCHTSQILHRKSDKPLVVHNKMIQFTLVKDGYGFFALNDTLYRIDEGSLLYIARNSSHSFMSENRLELVHWHFPKIFIESDRTILEKDCSMFKHLTKEKNNGK